MATGRDIVTQALRKAGVTAAGRPPNADDITDGLSDFNDMLGQWMTDRWLVWNLIDYSFSSTGALEYTVGPGGNFNIDPRPDRIESAFARQSQSSSQPVDYELEIIYAREQFNLITLKNLRSFPQYIFYDSAYPMATVRTYPVMTAALYSLHITVKNTLPVLDLDDDLSVPRQYIAAFKFNLARRLRQSYGKGLKPDPELNKLAASSLDVIRQANIQIPELQMPSALVRAGQYNILSDQWGK